MPATLEFAEEYAEELRLIRDQVCSRCIERPPGGPPCAPLGKVCGIELHLPELVQAIRAGDSPFIADYLVRNRDKICSHCAYLHTEHCPCPMDYLVTLIVGTVEAAAEKRRRRLNVVEGR
ncbi:MAG: hypothetical protein U0793_18840 [Gemmataceae bacterium]